MTANIESRPKLSPRDFLKARRPERFSDSVRKETGKLDRSVLEYQLATLNRRNLELAFEDFAKKLCEKVICPNLLEQTGPVAGGDGKVDTQTFPVSEQTKALWFVGVNENSHEDRWAFAVSTQEDWKAKCRKDVRKISATDRDYKKVFCVTNMYTKANQRSDLEDSLKKETGIDVRVLDISWIMDQIFSNSYEQLAIDALSIDVDWRREIEVGANDYTKTLRLQKLENNIKNEINTSEILPHQLNWLLEVAILSKELEKPVIETKGLFDRAIVASEKFGSSYQQFNAHYQYAWAAYWWFEEIELFREQLHFCVELAKKIGQSGQWGNVVSLLGLYSSHCRDSKSESLANYESLSSEVKNILICLAEKDERPSNALMSKAHIELLNLQSIESTDQATDIFSSLLSIVEAGELLVGFPFNELYDLITELDSIFGDLDSYELLLDYFTEQASRREGDTKGALLSLKRGARRLESCEPYQAIKLIGKSLMGLYKKETKKDLYVALNLLSGCYEKVDLLWASRANLLLAASTITDEFWESGDLLSAQVYIYIRLSIIELKLGRINYALSWWELACIVDANLEAAILTEKEHQRIDAYLSQCILNADIETLKYLSKLPDLLDKYQLFSSRAMLLYALGHENIVKGEYELKIDQEYINYLKIVRDIDLGAPVPILINCDVRYGTIQTSVMGASITVSFPFRSPLIELAETLLSVIEGFFSTGVVDQVFVYESRLEIEITADDDDEVEISHEVDDASRTLKINVLCSSFTLDMLNISGQEIIQRWLHDFVIDVFSRMVKPKNSERTLGSMLNEDRALERSVSFGACFVGLKNIMGNDAVSRIKSLLHDVEHKTYEMRRSQPWDSSFPKSKSTTKSLTDLTPGKEPPPEGLTDSENLTHKDIKVQDLIKIRLWDRTVWCGTGFALYPNGDVELTLLFEDDQAAAVIFADLENEIGNEDSEDRLRISIIRSIDRKNPAHYRVCISENFVFDSNKTVQMIARKNTMTPSTSENLDRFLSAFSERGSYILSYAVAKNERIIESSLVKKKSIRKFNINVLEAWEIGPNDIEVMAIHSDDDPLIPEGVSNPPIIESLKRKFG
ncbi:hypothetical protein MJO52_05410 [Microbulbifer variabilis]|uniref:Tetratricopeptide repeat protein n=1 Tax=Microbulbifer variabilis TaxID=266805 RepID=A0ABY4VE50_9GAMM|nr:hypothetical protein [Microbulbifer variabilis]USD22571.1 hypothetical protein MJO52_05410 [Microbulbifer variabilis]